jgi:predicted ester cyclase
VSTEENKAAERRFYEEVWHRRNPGAVDEFVAPEFVDHTPLPGQGPGREGFRQAGPALAFSAFPDAQITIEDVIAEGDKVVSRWTVRGTHRGAFMGIPRRTSSSRPRGSRSTATRAASGSRAGGSGTRWACCSNSASSRRPGRGHGEPDRAYPARGASCRWARSVALAAPSIACLPGSAVSFQRRARGR